MFRLDLASPAALKLLQEFLNRFTPDNQRLGNKYFDDGRVLAVWQDDEFEISADLRVPKNFTAFLVWDNEAWYADCTCQTDFRCAHAYAAGLAWVRKCEKGPAQTPPQSPSFNISPALAPTVAEFTAATGQPPSHPHLEFLDHLVALHRSISNHGYGWFDHTALQALAPAKDRRNLHGTGRNPFDGWWVQAPATPLLLWPFVALFFTECEISLPGFTAPFTHLDFARESRENARRAEQLKSWRHRFAELDRLAATAAAPANRQSLRLRLGAKKCIWELAPDGRDGRFAPLPAAAMRDLLHDPVRCAREFDDATNAMLLFFRGHLGARGRSSVNLTEKEDRTVLASVLNHPGARACIVADNGGPITDDPRMLTWQIGDHPEDSTQVVVRIAFADGSKPDGPLLHLPGRPTLYLQRNGALLRGLPPPQEPHKPLGTDFSTEVPRAALELPEAGRFAARSGVTLPGDTAGRFRAEPLRARLRAQLRSRPRHGGGEILVVEVHALAPDGTPRARLAPDGWNTKAPGLQPPRDAAYLLHDFVPLQAAAGHLRNLTGLQWDAWDANGGSYASEVTSSAFADNFSKWIATAPPDTIVELGPELAAFSAPPMRGHFALEVSESGVDWFDVHVSLRAEDTTLTAEEIELLRKANGRFIRLPNRGWRRLELALTPEDSARFERLGLDPAVLAESGRDTPRFHALQLADESLGEALPEKLWNQIRERAGSLRQVAAPPLPAGLAAEVRPYQLEGFHFLAHLSENKFGGILADDMGLGKTLQALAWLLWLDGRTTPPARPLRALVVCPKSVVFNWESETAKFAPALATARLAPQEADPVPKDARLVIVNYTQLRLNAEALAQENWDAVILDEGQNIKNPASATAQAARALRAANRIVLTGTPVENRLLDLWSLLAFAQPGLLGGQTSFKRLYNDRENPVAAHQRLAARVRHFLLRRTKAQVASDLPPRMEEEIIVELEGPQRKLYEAELKRARQMLLGVETSREFDAKRFNILQSLLRLRQICCDPRLVGAELTATKTSGRRQPADGEPETPASAKLEALLDTLEPLLAEGHRVLVFSQFVTMLELIRDELNAREIQHLLLTGQTENRQELVQRFQSPEGPPVFLLSLKAAGAGLNLTAASYVLLYDPWWNPAVEAQAIDRTHRIGQTSRVIAYRLLARDTVEEKIRALQREKASLAAAVVQEENLAQVLDLESLRRILA